MAKKQEQTLFESNPEIEASLKRIHQLLREMGLLGKFEFS